MTPNHNQNQYKGNISYMEPQESKRKQSDPPYIRMLTSPWAVASTAVEDINAMQDFLSVSETSSGIDMKSGSTTSSTTIRSESTNTSTLANISLDDEEFSQLINFDVSGGPELEVSHPHTDDLDLIDLEVNPTDIVSSILSDMLQSMHLQMCGSVNVDVHNVHDNV